MVNMASVVYLIIAIATGNSHQIQMESWAACKKVIGQVASDSERGGVVHALCVGVDGRAYTLQMALAERKGRRVPAPR